MEDVQSHNILCQYVSLNGEGIPCASQSKHKCFHCKTYLCGQHTRWRHWSGLPFDRPYCIACDEAAKAGHLKLHD